MTEIEQLPVVECLIHFEDGRPVIHAKAWSVIPEDHSVGIMAPSVEGISIEGADEDSLTDDEWEFIADKLNEELDKKVDEWESEEDAYYEGYPDSRDPFPHEELYTEQ